MESYKLTINIGNIIKFTTIILIVILLSVYIFFNIRNFIGNRKFANELIAISSENKEPIFKINKIILYSSAHAVDNSDMNLLLDLNLHQFSDVAVYIDNTPVIKELTPKNTIKEMYIDNIKINSNSKLGKKVLSYKNPSLFGVFQDLNNTDKINFEIIKSNAQNTEANYNTPMFFTDCSNPIPFGYVNKNIITNFNIEDEKRQVSFDGSILEKANIEFTDLECRISFDVHIKNNLDEEYVCNVVINNVSGSSDIYNGYAALEYSPSGLPYNFFKLSR